VTMVSSASAVATLSLMTPSGLRRRDSGSVGNHFRHAVTNVFAC
jgi:hypothetical protein